MRFYAHLLCSILLLPLMVFPVMAGVNGEEPTTLNSANQSLEPVENITLQDALSRVGQGPLVNASYKGAEAMGGRVKQAGLLPNPDISVEVENFNGKNQLAGLDGAELTASISQLVELGGKRGARKNVAQHESDVTGWDFQSILQRQLTEAAQTFYALLAAQEKKVQAEHLLELAQQGYQAVADRVEAGKASPVQELRARVELNTARVLSETAIRQVAQARHELAALWGSSRPDFNQAVGNFYILREPPQLEELQGQLNQNPDVVRWDAELAQKRSSLDLERANSIPDVTLSFGVRNFKETDENAYVGGLEFSLPVFDRNQGNRFAAQSEYLQAVELRHAEISSTMAELQVSYQKLLSIYNQAKTLQEQILPAAEQANETTQVGYREGKFDFLDALDAQRTLFDVKEQFVNSVNDYHEAYFASMRLAGRMIPGNY